MKILHVEAGRHLYGGALQALLLVEGLERRGVANLLVVPSGGDTERAARARSLPVRVLPLAGEADLRFLLRLRRLLREEAPDIVHLHSRRGADVLGALATRGLGLPVVLTRRVDNPEPRWTARLKYRLFDRVVTISEAIGDVLRRQGVPPEKLRTIPSAIEVETLSTECERDAFLAEFGLEAGDRVVGMAAQFIARKGYDVLLEAVPDILAIEPRARFLLFGRGPLEHRIRREVAERELEEAVRLAGFRRDLDRLLPCLEVLVHPARMEGLGVVLLQAAAAGVPAVASAAGGIPEVVADGETGLLFPPGDSAALARAVVSLLSDPRRARALGRAARRHVEKKFSTAAMVEGYLALYQEILQDAGVG